MKEAGVVVVVNEDTKSINILEVLVVSLPSAGNVSHRLSVHPDVSNCIVHGIVEETGDIILVGTHISIISIEALSHLEDASSLPELRPEVLGNLRNGIDTDSIEVVCLDEVLDPVLELSSYPLIALIKIGEAGKSAVFNLPLIVPIVDVTVSMIVFSSIERINLAVVMLDGSNVISDNVDHHPDAHLVSGIHQVLELLLSSKVIIDLLPVAGPVPMVTSITVVNDR
jgi:hypothetical protein